MKTILLASLLLVSTSLFAKESTTTVVFLRGSSMQEVQQKVDQLLLDLKTDKRIKELIPSLCNPTNSRRVERKAYKINFFDGSGSYSSTGDGSWKQDGPSAQVKVRCDAYKKD